jgi:tetratricopeptide (TPR) repeat protein
MTNDIQNFYEIAEDYIKQKKYDEVLNFLKGKLNRVPDNAELLIILAYVHSLLKFKDLSEEEVSKLKKKAHDLNKKSPIVWKYLGLMNYDNKEYDKALKCYKKAIDLNPEIADIWYEIGRTYQEKDKINKAIESYRKATELNPNLIIAWDHLANAYELEEDESNAINSYKKVISLIPDSKKEEDYNKKIEYYKNVLSLDPYDLDTWEHLGIIYEELGEHEKALVCFEKATEIAPYDINLLINIGNIYNIKKEYDKALEFYEKAIDTAPDHAIRKDIPIIETYKKILEIRPDDINLWINMGYAYEYKKQPDEAFNCYEKALRINPNHPLARYKWHEVYEKKAN